MIWADLSRRSARFWPPQMPPLATDLAAIGATGMLRVLSLVLQPQPTSVLVAALETLPLLTTTSSAFERDQAARAAGKG